MTLIFVFVFKQGNLTHKELWRTLLGLFIFVTVILNFRPHWSVEKKYRQIFEVFLAETSDSLQQKLFHNAPAPLRKCYPCTLEDVNAWRWYQRFPQWLCRLFAPLL